MYKLLLVISSFRDMESDKYDVYEGPNEIEKRSIQDPVHGLIRVRLN